MVRSYQVPVEVRPIRRVALAMRWLKESARKRGEKSMAARLANELLEASEGRGGAMKKRDEVHRMAEANKAFSHFRFLVRAFCPPGRSSGLSPTLGAAPAFGVNHVPQDPIERYRNIGISRISMPAKPRSPKAFFTTPV